MKRNASIIIMLGVVVAVGFLIFNHGTTPTPKRTVKSDLQPDIVPRAALASPATMTVHKETVAKTAAPVAAAPGHSWHDKLAALQGITELFGKHGEQNFKDLTDFVGTLTVADIPDALKELQMLQAQNATAGGHNLEMRLIRRWAELDVQSAADWIAQMPTGDDRKEAVSAVAGAWAQRDFIEASAWAANLADGIEKQQAQETIASEVAYANPVEALKLASTLPASPTLDETITRATSAWAAKSPEAAAAWAKQISDDTLRQQVVSSIAMTWSENNPVNAADLAISTLPPGTVQDRTVVAIVERWGLADEPAATAWVKQFPEGELREAAMASLNNITKRKEMP